jgi:copper transport protein
MTAGTMAGVTPSPRTPSRPAARTRRAAAGALVGVIVGLLAVLAGPAAPAAAHATLLRSDPAHNDVLLEPPFQVELRFSEPVTLVPGKIQVIGPDGTRVDTDEARAVGGTVIIPLGDASARGSYLVSFRVISADSHPVAGGITYAVGAPSETPPTPVPDEPLDAGIRTAIGVNKYLGYVGLVLLIAPVVMLALLWPERLSRRGPARMVWIGVGLVALTTLAGIWLQVPYTTGSGLFEVTGADLGTVLASTYGAAHLVRLGVLASAALLLRPVLAGRSGRVDAALLSTLGVVALATWPVAGHPAASPVPAMSIGIDVIHLTAAAFWVGGLIFLASFLLRRADARELGVILPVWSRWAALAVSALLLAGVTQALIEIGTIPALLETSYGRLVLVKVGLVAAVVGVAAYSRRLVRTRIGAERPGPLRMAVLAEAGLLATVLAFSSVLVQTTPARTAAADVGPPAPVDFVTTIDASLYSLQVQIIPAGVGNNVVHLYAYTLDGAPLPVAEWSASAALPAAGVEPIDVPLLAITDEHASGQAALPTPGEWEFRFTLRTTEIDQETVSVSVPIA